MRMNALRLRLVPLALRALQSIKTMVPWAPARWPHGGLAVGGCLPMTEFKDTGDDAGIGEPAQGERHEAKREAVHAHVVALIRPPSSRDDQEGDQHEWLRS